MAAALLNATAPELGPAIAPQIEDHWERITSEKALWPGFDPGAIPLAVYDGENTYLFRHPAPPEGFKQITAGAARMPGRHAAVVANSSADIGSVSTATLITTGEADAQAWAATALHEAFHVFQRSNHSEWSADEGAAFLYPVDDPAQLEHRRFETLALRQALAADDPDTAACWAHRALAHRDERFSIIDETFAEYERRNELNEGLATYVADQVRGTKTALPPEGWEAEQVRLRLYGTGAALAHLLDRFSADWKRSLEADDGQYLDEMLRAALPAASAPCSIAPELRRRIARQARADAGAVAGNRRQLRSAFETLPGDRIRIVTGEGPLWPQRFDPWNTQVLDGGEDLLHTRMLKLGNDGIEMELMNTADSKVQAVTSPAGAHPLFQGIVAVEIAGLDPVSLVTEGDRLILETTGFRAQVPPGSLTRRGELWIVER